MPWYFVDLVPILQGTSDEWETKKKKFLLMN